MHSKVTLLELKIDEVKVSLHAALYSNKSPQIYLGIYHSPCINQELFSLLAVVLFHNNLSSYFPTAQSGFRESKHLRGEVRSVWGGADYSIAGSIFYKFGFSNPLVSFSKWQAISNNFLSVHFLECI